MSASLEIAIDAMEGILTVITLFACVLVVRSSATKRLKLAFLLSFAGLIVANTTQVAAGVLPDRTLSFNAQLASVAAGFVQILAYLTFVGEAIDVPLTRWQRTRVSYVSTIAAGFALGAVCYVAPALVADHDVGRDATGGWVWPISLFVKATDLLPMAVYTYSIACAVMAFRRAPESSRARRRALAYARAFVLMDASVLGFALTQILVPGEQGFAANAVLWESAFGIAAFAAGLLLAAHAMLRDHLFDVDVRIKQTIGRGTLSAIFLATFFVVGQLAQGYFATADGWIVGGVAAGLLLFALHPLQRAAERVAEAAMPGTTGTPEYLARRKHEIYRAALEEATRDGTVSTKERRLLLLRLSSDLGLSAEEAARIEQVVIGPEATT
jgi:hypothetical protein